MNPPGIQLMVQSMPQDIQHLMLHYQDNPFPGGLAYSMEIRDPEIVKSIVEKFNLGKRTDLPRAEASWIFMFLQIAFGLKRRDLEPKFWMNNITEMDVSEDSVLLKGVCSPHIKT